MTGSSSLDGLDPAARDQQARGRSAEAQAAGRHPGREVVAGSVPDPAGVRRRDAGADHVGGEDPAEDDAGPLEAEVLAAQRHRRRHGGHPVEAVEEDEDEQARVTAGQQPRHARSRDRPRRSSR